MVLVGKFGVRTFEKEFCPNELVATVKYKIKRKTGFFI
jgi:hypothetical protein